MRRNDYQRTARKILSLITIWSIIFAVAVVLLVQSLGPSIQSFGHSVRAACGEFVGGLIGSLLLGVPLFLAWLAVALFLDRTFGLRCPQCHHSLTARSEPRRVLDTGECSLCHAHVFDETNPVKTDAPANPA